MPVITVKMFGSPAVSVDGRQVVLPYRRAEALLYYLILNRKVSRNELVDLLWTDTDVTTALKNLRHAIYTVRKRLGCDFFLTGQRTVLEVNPDVELRCDALDFVERGVLSPHQGEFLEGFRLQDSDLFDNWLEEQRNLFRTQYLKKLLDAEKKALAVGDWNRAEQFGLEYVDRDPLDEAAAVALMEIYSTQKKFRKAIGVYHELCRNLAAELSIAPLKETTAFYYKIVNDWNASTYKLEEQPEHLLVGKDAALRKLLTLCGGSPNESRAPCALIEGEAGVGKTHLLDHILNHYDFSDRLVCRCSCYQSEMHTPLAPWSAVMLTIASEIQSRHIALPESYLKTAAGIFPCLTANFSRDYVQSDVDYPLQTSYHVAQESALLILSMVSRQAPLLLVFEDIHWIDKSSCEMLAHFLRRLRSLNVTVLCTSRNDRPDYVDGFIKNARMDKILERYVLNPFSQEETRQFIRHHMGEEQSAELVERVYESTGGNALLLVQLLNSVQESREMASLPSDLDDIIGYRLANLSLDERQVLDLISVFTDWAAFDILASILTRDTIDLIYICSQLKQRLLVTESERDGMLSYALAHEQIKAALRRQQSESTRRLLHLRVAQCLEQYEGSVRYRHYDRLIYHYAASGNRFKTFQYRVRSLNAYTGLCYALMPTLAGPSDLAAPEAESLPRELKELEGELAELRASFGDQEQLDRLEMLLLHIKGSSHIYGGQYPSGLEALERLTRLSHAAGDTEMLIRAHLQYVYYAIQTHNIPIMEEHLAVQRQLLENRKASADYGIYLRLAGLLQSMKGRHERAREVFRASIRTFQYLPNSGDGRYAINIAGVYNYIAESYRVQGDYDQAFYYYDQAIVHNRSRGYYPGAAVFYTNYGVAAHWKGETYAARHLFDYAVEIYHSSQECSGYPIAMSYLALYEAEEGGYESAAERLREAHWVSDTIESPGWKGTTIYMSWKIRRLLERREVRVPELDKQWPADPREHCLWGLSYLSRLKNYDREREEMERDLEKLR